MHHDTPPIMSANKQTHYAQINTPKISIITKPFSCGNCICRCQYHYYSYAIPSILVVVSGHIPPQRAAAPRTLHYTLPAQEVFAKAQPKKTVRALMTLQWSSTSMDAIIISLYCKYECWFVCEKSVIEFKFSPTGYTLRFVIMQTVVPPPPPPPPTFCSPKELLQPTKHCTAEGVMNNAVAAEHYVLQMC